MIYNYDKSFAEIKEMLPGIEKACQLAVIGLLTDGAHHKQWALEEVLKALEQDLDKLREQLQANDYDWYPGIVP